ncbi:hypothetical protein AXG93_496s1110 [Marchantia polymorpha subsp. ruderalis]|uniref:Uncharacterized protein n=1 Tax=Marchantia polymorpha subsp. ruderalis TaxID=1480154 RepID=A0A176VSK7_MARPO|nr:hypothetical protein AXG93_496s1110 [Marchantia polymorpha subsp. ruderalis]
MRTAYDLRYHIIVQKSHFIPQLPHKRDCDLGGRCKLEKSRDESAIKICGDEEKFSATRLGQYIRGSQLGNAEEQVGRVYAHTNPMSFRFPRSSANGMLPLCLKLFTSRGSATAVAATGAAAAAA